jgi:hypothetical protein
MAGLSRFVIRMVAACLDAFLMFLPAFHQRPENDQASRCLSNGAARASKHHPNDRSAWVFRRQGFSASQCSAHISKVSLTSGLPTVLAARLE